VKKQMACIGHEKGRETIKYRCPAMHDGLPCPSLQKCNGEKAYGLVVRVKCEEDLRRFPPIARATRQFERRYKGRTAVERVNARVKVFWGVDDGNVVGARRFHAHVGVVMVVHLALAAWLAKQPRWEGSLSRVSLSPIARALARMDEECAPDSLPDHDIILRADRSGTSSNSWKLRVNSVSISALYRVERRLRQPSIASPNSS
jgi:hypothetical protein